MNPTNAQLAAAALNHLNRYQQACLSLEDSPGVWNDCLYHPCPLFVLWCNLEKCHIAFFGLETSDEAGRISYAVIPSGTGDHSVHEGPLPEALRVAAEKFCLGNVLVFHYSSDFDTLPQAHYRNVAVHARRLYMATAQYYRKIERTRRLSNWLERARIQGKLPSGLEEDADALYSALTVFLVAALETGLQDLFISFSESWFQHLKNRGEILAAGRRFASACLPRRKRLKFLLVLWRSGLTRAALCESIRQSGGLKRINFQDLRGKRSAKWAFRLFLNVDLPATAEQLISGGWEVVTDFLQRRHLIIHDTAGGLHDALSMGLEQEIVRSFYGKVIEETCKHASIKKTTPL